MNEYLLIDLYFILLFFKLSLPQSKNEVSRMDKLYVTTFWSLFVPAIYFL